MPSGLKLSLDGIPHTTPFPYDTLIDFSHTLDAPDQTLGSNVYSFSSWSDGGPQEHTVVVPSAAQVYVATFDLSQVQVPPGLVAGYRFSEGTGTTTVDLSGNNSTGSLVNGPAWTAGQYGSALAFSGDDYVDVGNPPRCSSPGA